LPFVIKKVIISTFVKDVFGCPIYSVDGTLQRVGIEVWVRVPPSALLPHLTDLPRYLISPAGAAEVDAGSMRVKGLSGIDISGEQNRVVP
jgi:hypothetical protein